MTDPQPLKNCAKCAKEVPEGAGFCPHCQTPLAVAGPENSPEKQATDISVESSTTTVSEKDAEARFWQSWEDSLEKIENGIPWNAVFVVLGTGFLLLTYFFNK